MKKLIRTFVILLVVVNCFAGQAQVPTAEKPFLFVDRGLYISGEVIYFTAFCLNNDSLPTISSVLYADLVSPDGNALAKGKFPLENGNANGCLTIPKDILSGNYYLRVYTKYMRNEGALAFPTVPVKIVNPNRNDVSAADTNATDLLPIETSGDNHHNNLSIAIDKKRYHPRDTVYVNINAENVSHNELQNLCIAVVPQSAEANQMIPLHFNRIKNLVYYPENRGLSLTGKLTDSLTGKAIGKARVNLSIIGTGRDFMAVQTDEKGRFFFALPSYKGKRDLFLCTGKTDDKHPKILVDNDFSSGHIHLPSPLFTLTKKERALAYQLAVNTQIQEAFHNDSIGCTGEKTEQGKAFYGKPSSVLKLDQYVRLPTLEDYLNELPTMVKVRKRKGKKYFKILGTQPEMSIYDPLILVDWVAVDNPKKILAASPADIDRIEVVTTPYIKGDMHYGGIVSIVSKKGDFAGINLPSSGIFLNYLFMSTQCLCAAHTASSLNSPDARNTVYWNPNMRFNTDKKVDFSFTMPDTPGNYSIVLQGVGLNGKTFFKKIGFTSKRDF